MTTKVYDFKDHTVVLSHPDVGSFNLSDGGIGKVTVAFSGEDARLTTSADGSVVVNKIANPAGTVNVEVPQVGDANDWLKKYVNYLRNAHSSRFALGRMLIKGASNDDVICESVVPQKMADVVYDAESQTRSWSLLAAKIDMK